jgi:hypothetical protein
VICANHKCRAEFETPWRVQIYCCASCKTTERNFRKTWGEKAINAAVDGRDPLPVIADALRIMSGGVV